MALVLQLLFDLDQLIDSRSTNSLISTYLPHWDWDVHISKTSAVCVSLARFCFLPWQWVCVWVCGALLTMSVCVCGALFTMCVCVCVGHFLHSAAGQISLHCILCTQNYGDKGRLGSPLSAGNWRQFHTDTRRKRGKRSMERRSGWNTCCLAGGGGSCRWPCSEGKSETVATTSRADSNYPTCPPTSWALWPSHSFAFSRFFALDFFREHPELHIAHLETTSEGSQPTFVPVRPRFQKNALWHPFATTALCNEHKDCWF